MKTAADIIPPPPHKVIEPPHSVLKNVADDVKGLLDNARDDVKDLGDDVRHTIESTAPHNLVKEIPKPSASELKPPAPPKPPKPPKLSES